MVRRRYDILGCVIILLAASGCRAPCPPLASLSNILAHGITAQPNPFLLDARLLSVRSEPPWDVLHFVTHAPSYDAELRFWLTCYAATRPANGYPTNAILVLVRNAPNEIELLGKHARYSVYEANPENERRLGKKIRESSLLPKPDSWLPREHAVQIAKDHFGSGNQEFGTVTSQREAFGWSVHFDNPVIGGDTTIVVDDTGRVLATFLGF